MKTSTCKLLQTVSVTWTEFENYKIKMFTVREFVYCNGVWENIRNKEAQQISL